MSLQKFTFLAVGFMTLCVVISTLSDVTSQPTQAAAVPQLGRSTQTLPVTSSPQALIESRGNADTVIAILSSLPTETPDRYADLHGTQTALGLQKEQLDQEETELRLQLLRDAATSTAGAQATSTAVAAVLYTQMAQTQGAATQHTGETQIAGTATSIPLTQAALAKTQQVEEVRLWVKKAQVVVWPVLFVLVFIAFAVLGWIWLEKRIAAKHLQDTQIRPDEKGRYPVIPADAIPGKSKRTVNPNLAHRAVTDPQKDDLTSDQALANTQSHRNLEATRAITQSPALMRQMLRKPAVTTETGMPEANTNISRPASGLLDSGIAAPSWSMVESWDGKGPIPYGVSARGLERVDLSQNYHVGVFGKTGQGKSRYFLRPFIVSLLASGHRVIVLGKSGDFWPFASHPNAKMITVRDFTNPAEAQRYADCLLSIVKEKNRRDEYLTSHHTSTWEVAGRENTYLVFDELGNALSEMQSKIREETHSRIISLVNEGRKVGLCVLLASQRAVGFKSIVEQMGRVAFHLSDPDASRHAIGIPGAENLPDGSGHFLAKFGRINHCVSFNPTDDELTRFLQERPVGQLEPIDWIEGTATEIKPEPVAPAQSAVDPEEEQIRTILLRMVNDDAVSMRQVEREVWGKARGGQYYDKVLKVWKEIKGTSATTATPKTPESGAIAA